MVLLSLSVFFCWLIYREIRNPAERFSSFSLGYMSILVILAVACARPAYKIWRLETFLSEQASIIAERPNIKVRCNSIFETLFDGKAVGSFAGTAYFETGEIFFDNGWCKNIMAYLEHPEDVSQDQLFSMHVFTHEVMHIRGERNERKTDCQAIQRNHHVGELLGIEQSTARRNAIEYYRNYYPKHHYFDANCKPNGKYDEKVADPIWLG